MKKNRKNYPNTVPFKSQLGKNPNVRLKRLRMKLNLSQNQLAEMLRNEGFRCASGLTVSAWETNINPPPGAVYKFLAAECARAGVAK